MFFLKAMMYSFIDVVDACIIIDTLCTGTRVHVTIVFDNHPLNT